MFAVIKTGGKQYRVHEGDILQIEKLNLDKGKKVAFDKILLIEDEGKTLIGTPFIENALVRAEVVDNLKGEKVIVFKKKRRKQYRKKIGHRQEFTHVKIEQILPSGKGAPKQKPVSIISKEKEIEILAKDKAKKPAEKREAKDAAKVQEIANALETEYLKDKLPKKKEAAKATAKTEKPSVKKEKENGS